MTISMTTVVIISDFADVPKLVKEMILGQISHRVSSLISL